jgi:hypothetical protein
MQVNRVCYVVKLIDRGLKKSSKDFENMGNTN